MISNYDYLVRLCEEVKRMETTTSHMYTGLIMLVTPCGQEEYKLYKNIILEVQHIDTQFEYLRHRLSDLALLFARVK